MPSLAQRPAMFKIERSIPLPPPSNRNSALRNTMRACNVGDSFLVPTEKERKSVTQSTKDVGGKFATRKEGNAFRVWRVE